MGKIDACGRKETRPDTRHKMRLVCVLFTFENNAGRTYGPTDQRTDGRTDGHDLLNRDATAHLKTAKISRFPRYFWIARNQPQGFMAGGQESVDEAKELHNSLILA